MKIVCLIKFVPDTDRFQYDFERNTVIRENVKLILNPDDAAAVALALRCQAAQTDTQVEIVTLAPRVVLPFIEDLLRLGVDKATLISDPLFAGSDTYASSQILSAYLRTTSFDLILSGTHSLDGDTAHVPAQVGEWLALAQISHVIAFDESKLNEKTAVFTVDNEADTSSYEIDLPAILSLKKESRYKLPYLKYEDMQKDLTARIHIVTNHELGLGADEIGIQGSRTKVQRTFIKEYDKREAQHVGMDEDGIEQVYSFLKDKGFL